jgi:tRNA (adenine22-N1)-methyltransferase
VTARLRAVAERVPEGSRVVDVGADHAKLTLWLEKHKSCKCIATDKNPNPLKIAALAGASDTRLGDGLTCVSPDEVDTVVIAGMGGETINGILDASPWAREKMCVLQPASRPERLRKFLEENGYNISADFTVAEGRRVYTVIVTEEIL